MKSTPRLRTLGRAEQVVMDYLWTHGPASSEACRAGLASAWPMKESTMRTVLMRLEKKGYVTHAQDGRAYIYQTSEGRAGVAARAVRAIIERFCGGSAEQLVIGMVDNAVLEPRQLERLARRIAQGREAQRREKKT